MSKIKDEKNRCINKCNNSVIVISVGVSTVIRAWFLQNIHFMYWAGPNIEGPVLGSKIPLPEQLSLQVLLSHPDLNFLKSSY